MSGFNRRQSEDVIEERRDCRVRNRLGGINYFFRADLFDQLRRFLFTTAWDTLVQVHFERHRAHGYRMLCTKPSYVQHIGKVGMNSGPNKQFDVADDFVQSPIRRRSGFAN